MYCMRRCADLTSMSPGTLHVCIRAMKRERTGDPLLQIEHAKCTIQCSCCMYLDLCESHIQPSTVSTIKTLSQTLTLRHMYTSAWYTEWMLTVPELQALPTATVIEDVCLPRLTKRQQPRKRHCYYTDQHMMTWNWWR
jgi:hypothetical protein